MLRPALIAASVAWALLLPFASLGASGVMGSAAAYGSASVYAIGSIVCHQRPERSFQLWGHQLPVCARCTGIYVGASLAALCVAMARARRMMSPRSARILLAAAAIPTLATLAYEWSLGSTPSNILRAAAGVPLGAAASAIALAAASDRVN